MRKMTAIMNLAAAAALAGILLTGCSTEADETTAATTAAEAETTTAAVGESAVTTNQMAGYIKEDLEAEGAEVFVIDTANDFAELASRIEDVVSSGTDGIVLVSADPNQVANQLQDAFDADIPVFGCDSGFIDGMQINATSDNYQMGELIVRYLFDDLMGGKGTVIALTHRPHPGVVKRCEAFDDIIKEYPDIKLITEQHVPAEQPINDAQDIVANLLTANPEKDSITAVFAAWDEPAIGATKALQEAGRDEVIVTGVDGNEQAIEMINADTMLVVVDVNNPSLTECEELISYAKTVVVFDHHRQTKDVIANATLSYVEPFASSACEMIAEMLQYMDEKIKLRPSEADAMYAGILIDTDNFLTKTGVRTFEAAAYLRRSGADVMRVRKMFRSDIDSYRQKADGVRNAEMVLGMFAVSVFEPKEGPESPIVLTAKVANEMLNIAGVRASFVIAQLGDDVKISARSIDDVNVQIIMERMGGGGHANIAAAQFTNTTKEEVKEQLVNLLEEMYKEGDI